jgi:hypothetical protein
MASIAKNHFFYSARWRQFSDIHMNQIAWSHMLMKTPQKQSGPHSPFSFRRAMRAMGSSF